MALAAAGRVEDRPQAVRDGFGTGELLDGGVEVALVGGNLRRVGRVRQRVLVRAELLGEAVGEVVESRVGASVGSFRRSLGRLTPIPNVNGTAHTAAIPKALKGLLIKRL